MSNKRSLAEIHTAVVLFGLAGLFGKWLSLSPLIIVLGRVFFASLALLLFLFLSKQKMSVSPAKNFVLFILLGFILAVHWTAFFQSIQVSTVAVGLLSYSSFPVFTAFLEPFFFKEKLETSAIFYALLCMAGIFLIVPRFAMDNIVYRGVLWGLAAGLTFSILTILNRKLIQRYSSLVIAFYQDLWATLFLLPFFLILKPRLEGRDVLLLLILGIFCTAISHSLFIKGMRRIKAQTAAVISSLEPVYGIIMALLFLKEIPSLRTVLGGMIILGTAYVVTWRGARP